VYTVIAGVLNLLVIYDAFAGPMFREPIRRPEDDEMEEATPGAKPTKPPTPDAPTPATSPPAAPAPSPPQQGGA
jgi:hypothetical protein